MELSDYDRSLLRSLVGGRKYLDIGYSPVRAIERAFALMDMGLVVMNEGWLTLSRKGIQETENDVPQT